MTPQELRAEVAALHWWHRIDLGQGVVTPGADDSPAKLSRLSLPVDLTGKRVLDIGAWDGFFSFEAERRGAAGVLAVDAAWQGPDGGAYKRGFNLARRALSSHVEDRQGDVLGVRAEEVGTFDLVLMLGVLYHTRHPLLVLERIFSLTRPGGLLILETETDMLWRRRPALAFYPGAELNGDPTNWFAPNERALLGMVAASGFNNATVKYRTPLLRRIGRALKHRRTDGAPVLHGLERGRAVVHAVRSAG